MDKRFWGILAVIAVVFVGIIVVSNHKKAGTPGSTSATSSQPTNHVEGKNTKGVTLVEYGDYQCPVCGEYYATLKQVTDKYQNDIAFQFRNFPLTQLHPNAFAGARAAEAAGKQNKYWEMHDALYINQNAWSAASDPLNSFVGYAQQIGLNTDQFKKDYASDAVNQAINADIAAGNKLNVSGTPTFYLNGKEVQLEDLIDPSKQNQPSADKFSKVIDDAIAAAAKKS